MVQEIFIFEKVYTIQYIEVYKIQYMEVYTIQYIEVYTIQYIDVIQYSGSVLYYLYICIFRRALYTGF